VVVDTAADHEATGRPRPTELLAFGLATKDPPPHEERNGDRLDNKRADDDHHYGAHAQRLRGFLPRHTVKT
jgi:hypothetical protein